MLKLSGPTYKYSGESLGHETLVYVADHHYDAENHCYQIEPLLNTGSAQVIFDHVLEHDGPLRNRDLMYFPCFMAKENRQFVTEQIVPDWTQKRSTFNFMINKPRAHREFLLLLLTHFGLHTDHYTLPWANRGVNRSALCQQAPQYQDWLTTTPFKWDPHTYLIGSESVMDQGVRNGHIKNSTSYKQLFQKAVFEPTYVSLITEPALYEQETIITEKTLMSIWAGTLPIWVGGWRIPDLMRSQGFDVFDDIIDHSYQCLPRAWDRVYRAIESNLAILQNPDLCCDYFERNQHRFQHNLALALSQPWLAQCLDQIQSSSGDLQKNLLEILGQFVASDQIGTGPG